MNGQKKSQLTIIFLTVFIYLVGFGIMIPIMPVLSRDFGATPLQVGLLMTVYSLMQFVFAPFWGKLSDRLGRRPILIFCLLGEGASYLVFAWAKSLEWLFVARIFAGFFGASISTASAYISDVTPKNERSKGMALIGVAFGLGFILGPAIGGGLTLLGETISAAPHFATSFCAVFVAILCFANFIFAYFSLPESLSIEIRNQVKVDVKKKQSRLNLFFEIGRRKTLGPLILVYFLATTAMALMESTLVLLVGDRFGWGIKEVSFGFAYIGIVATFNQGFLVRKLLPKWGEQKMLLIGLIFFGIGLTGIAFATNLVLMGITITLLSFGHSFTNPSIMGSISLLSGEEEQGKVMGSAQSAASLGRIVGPAMGGFLYGNLTISAPFLASGLIIFLALIIIFKILNHLPQSAKIV
jgi:MFS transporter, DHA1 family, tetracycline resistance protein